jgi:hypothetical protein
VSVTLAITLGWISARQFNNVDSQFNPTDSLSQTVESGSPGRSQRQLAIKLLQRAANDLAELNVIRDSLAAHATQHSRRAHERDDGVNAFGVGAASPGAGSTVPRNSPSVRRLRVVSECRGGAADAIVWQCSDQLGMLSDNGRASDGFALEEIAFDRAMQLLCVNASGNFTAKTPPKAVWPPTTSPDNSDSSGVFAVRLDCRFASNYDSMFDASGWVDRAFVVHVDETRAGSAYPVGTPTGFLNMVRSVHEHSRATVLAFSTGPPGKRPSILPDALAVKSSEPLSQLVHFFIDEMSTSSNGIALGPSFAMVRMVLASRARAVLVLPPRVIVGRRVDELFARAHIHADQGYPFPILPKFNMAHSFPTVTASALPFLARIYTTAAGGGVQFANDDWLSASWTAKKLQKEWCVWAFSLGQEPHKLPTTGTMCDCVLDYSSSSRHPVHVLDTRQRAHLWRAAGCHGEKAWLGYNQKWYEHYDELALQQPGCVA